MNGAKARLIMIPASYLAPIIAMSLLALGACQSEGARKPAVLASSDLETMNYVKSVLAEAMDVAHVEIGAGDPARISTISVLPRRPSQYEGMSPAEPTQFDIVLIGARCCLVRRDTGETYELRNVSCRALSR